MHHKSKNKWRESLDVGTHGCWGSAGSAMAAASSSSRAVIVFFLILIGCGLLSAHFLDTSFFLSSDINIFKTLFTQSPNLRNPGPKPPVHLNCPQEITQLLLSTHSYNNTISLPPSPSQAPSPTTPPSTCPSYFRWIYEDLRPWASMGITRETLERSRPDAAFRLVVVNGRAYMDKYDSVYQSRDVLTLWGILQLLNRYPERVPDFELMFNCEDMPVVRPDKYTGLDGGPPPLFRYCKDDSTVDIVFPDWSFWGWPEIKIKPWMTLSEELKEGNKMIPWEERDPHAYWKGNPEVARSRKDLMKCNASWFHDWNVRLYAQDWDKESKHGFNTSDLASQCDHRFMIYIEGRAWSVSEKYILACNSPTLFVTSRFHDFFTRGLVPGHHFLPIPAHDKCRSIKAAVDWGNTHKDQAQAIGKAGSEFVQQELKMDYVYDYMLHLLSGYSKLLRFKPSVPENAVELSLKSMACQAEGRVQEYMMESMVRGSHEYEPCAMPPPFGQDELKELLERKAKASSTNVNYSGGYIVSFLVFVIISCYLCN